MRNLSESLTFTLQISSEAHRLAEQFSLHHYNPHKAKQVYLNTLAVFAVKFYLRCMGIDTNWKASSSWNPVKQTLLDVADLEVIGLGKIECRPVLPAENVVRIPPEVCLDRIGYVAVKLDESLRKATLLGFSRTATESCELPISELRSLEDLLLHLHLMRQAEPVNIQIHLCQWFESIFETGWLPLEALLGKKQENFAFSVRGDSQLSETSVKRAKLIDLGLELESEILALLVAITPEAEKVGILVELHPMVGEIYLPSHLRLALLSESGEILQSVQSRSQDNYIKLKKFRGYPRECFKIQVAFGNATWAETFRI